MDARCRPPGATEGPVLRRFGSPALLAAAIFAATLPAFARHSDVVDANDVSGKFDIREVEFGHKEPPPVWTVVTFQKWRVKQVWDRGYVLVFLDTVGDGGSDFYALVRSDGEVMRARLFRDRASSPDADKGPLRAWRRGGQSVSVAVPLRRLVIGSSRTSYGWWVQTLMIGPACHRACIDRAPDAGAVDQPLPGPSPSPTPSP